MLNRKSNKSFIKKIHAEELLRIYLLNIFNNFLIMFNKFTKSKITINKIKNVCFIKQIKIMIVRKNVKMLSTYTYLNLVA